MINETMQTSDESLRKMILASLAANESAACAGVRVGVLKGIVHLAGRVSTSEIRLAAAELARQHPGVRGVVNRIDAPGAPRPARTIHLNPEHEEEITR